MTPIKSVKTTVDIIELLAAEGAMGVTEIAESLKMPKSTAHDHLRTLAEMDILARTSEGYHLTSRFLYVGSRWRYDQDVYRVAKEQVDQYARDISEHVSLSIEENNKSVVIYTIKGSESVRLEVFPGKQSPIHTTAAGKAILAFLSDKRVDEIIATEGLQSFTPDTITSQEDLWSELETIREKRYATNFDEQVPGMGGYAVPILSSEGVHGAISVYGPTNRISTEEKKDEIINDLQKIANVIQVNLAYPG
jgi:DNA-binding IclR family transcriptional regulator